MKDTEMSVDENLTYHDEVELEDFEWDDELEAWTYPCPCGDRFAITPEELEFGEEVATCPSCSLIVKVIYDPDSIPEAPESTEVKANTSQSRSKPTVTA